MRLVESKPESDLSGKQLGEYLLMRRLGRGGMADVYLAEQKSLRRQVAFKVLHRNLAEDGSYVRRFHNEAQAVAALVNANIVQIHEVGCIDGVHFIAQEYVAGQNLQQVLTRRGPLSIRFAVDVMRQVAAALHCANEKGIVHRDIKPENILLSSSGEVKVADFGLARVAESKNVGLTQVGMTMGTPLYMSPEQVEAKQLDHRSDVYSLGVTCYQMLAGRTPFEGETALSVAVQHLKNAPKPLAERRPDLPDDICFLVHKMLAKSPSERYQTASDLLLELRELQIPGTQDDWPSDLADASTPQWPASTASGTAATAQLQTVMLAYPQKTSLRRVALWITMAVCVAFGVGGLLAWATRPENLLARSNGPAIPRFDTATEQFSYAMTIDGALSEAAFKSVIKHFGKDAAPASESSVNKAKLHLAYYFHDTDRIDEAMKLFAELSEQGTDLQLRVMALIRQANIYSQQDQLSEASRCTFKLARLIEQTEELTPRQRQGLRLEATRGLDRDVLPEFRRHLATFQSEARRR